MKPTPVHSSSRGEALYAILDTLIAAKIDLCGANAHPTRASLDEGRFRQACEALAAGIALLKDLVARTDAEAPIVAAIPRRYVTHRAAPRFGLLSSQR